jgi:hypothetical protein
MAKRIDFFAEDEDVAAIEEIRTAIGGSETGAIRAALRMAKHVKFTIEKQSLLKNDD